MKNYFKGVKVPWERFCRATMLFVGWEKENTLLIFLSNQNLICGHRQQQRPPILSWRDIRNDHGYSAS